MCTFKAALGDHALSEPMQSLAGCNPSAEGRPNVLLTLNEPIGAPMVPLQISRCLAAPMGVALSFTVQHPFYFSIPTQSKYATECFRMGPIPKGTVQGDFNFVFY
jgi:hypothetical protein